MTSVHDEIGPYYRYLNPSIYTNHIYFKQTRRFSLYNYRICVGIQLKSTYPQCIDMNTKSIPPFN